MAIGHPTIRRICVFGSVQDCCRRSSRSPLLLDIEPLRGHLVCLSFVCRSLPLIAALPFLLALNGGIISYLSGISPLGHSPSTIRRSRYPRPLPIATFPYVRVDCRICAGKMALALPLPYPSSTYRREEMALVLLSADPHLHCCIMLVVLSP
jgi:hypothetical protein